MESCGGLTRSLDSSRSLGRAPLQHIEYPGTGLFNKGLDEGLCVLGAVLDIGFVTRLVDWLLVPMGAEHLKGYKPGYGAPRSKPRSILHSKHS